MVTGIFCRGGGNEGSKLVLLRIPTEDFEAESEKAYCFKVNSQKIWLPKSQIQEWGQNDLQTTFWLPRWLVEEKSLEYFIDTSHEPSLFD